MTTPVRIGQASEHHRNYAGTALGLGLTSIVLLIAGFTVMPFAFELAPLAAIAALVYAVIALRAQHERRATTEAVVSIALVGVTMLVVVLLVLAFTFSPGD